MNAYKVNISSGLNGSTETATINLGSPKHFYAWCQMNMVDSLNNFDRDNAIAIEIYSIDGNRTGWFVSGGDHWGSSNTSANVHQGALSGYGQRITFRIRAMHKSDLTVSGSGIVLVP